MKIEVKDNEVVIPNSLAKEMYDHFNMINIPYEEKERFIIGLRVSVQDTLDRLEPRQKGE